MADSNDDAVICKAEATGGFEAFWNEGGGISIEQFKSEEGPVLVALSVSEAKCLVDGLAGALGYYLKKIEGVPDVE